MKNKDESLWSSGTRLKNYDPRARIIKKHVDDVLEVTGRNPKLEIAVELEKRALDDEFFTSRKLYPNVDFYSGLIYEALGLPVEMFPVMFAIPRTSGWIAQWRRCTDPETKSASRARATRSPEQGYSDRPARAAYARIPRPDEPYRSLAQPKKGRLDPEDGTALLLPPDLRDDLDVPSMPSRALRGISSSIWNRPMSFHRDFHLDRFSFPARSSRRDGGGGTGDVGGGLEWDPERPLPCLARRHPHDPASPSWAAARRADHRVERLRLHHGHLGPRRSPRQRGAVGFQEEAVLLVFPCGVSTCRVVEQVPSGVLLGVAGGIPWVVPSRARARGSRRNSLSAMFTTSGRGPRSGLTVARSV